MSRSPLAYPLNRSADTDVGGAADLQTDIMRFMAILSLCLVAIFALVQSIPLTPAEPVEPAPAEPQPVVAEAAEPLHVEMKPVMPEPKATATVPDRQKKTVAEPAPDVSLRRPKWVPQFQPTVAKPMDATVVADSPPPAEPTPTEEPEGFVLRFESDAALMRAVAASHVGLYAIEDTRARRMTVSESRVSFWDASTPNTFHEMESATVPGAVIEALSRTGADAGSVSWGVTLPGKLKTRLDALMESHQGGSLIISAGGNIHWEAS